MVNDFYLLSPPVGPNLPTSASLPDRILKEQTDDDRVFSPQTTSFRRFRLREET
ncbi:hypothetical protein AGR4C_Cc80309 [Agrobacterium tumefaciens str. Kerr 14]|uniref:Uncharacterized protein n=1 Tax=Agrobacterium tumefaciens str. Kerr 14 TaxID=1183424 RepID=A0A1S7QNV4_AGRTU|nr:hypothetical protein AGR4B_Cc60807 [Agrobacterium tumefaciens str. CFBP 5621]CUX39513.1 hypothetical protein AGR4C_Cc80309 [Agrobacterium tumefaciens str. Kerr 14]